MTTDDRLYTIEDIAAHLGQKVDYARTIHHRTQAGHVGGRFAHMPAPVRKIGRSYVWDGDAIDRWVQIVNLTDEQRGAALAMFVELVDLAHRGCDREDVFRTVNAYITRK